MIIIIIIIIIIITVMGPRGRLVVKHYATSCKVAGLRSDEMNTFFNLPNPFGPGVYLSSDKDEYQKLKNNVSGEWSAAGV
jgi:hypothetical protein